MDHLNRNHILSAEYIYAILSVVSLCATGGQIVHKNFSLTVKQGTVSLVS